MVQPYACQGSRRNISRTKVNQIILHYNSIDDTLQVTGLLLMLPILVHMLLHPYIDVVMANSGFIDWLWAVLIVSVLILCVAAYGIVTALNRTIIRLIIVSSLTVSYTDLFTKCCSENCNFNG